MIKQRQIIEYKMKEKAKHDELKEIYIDNEENACFLCDKHLPFPD